MKEIKRCMCSKLIIKLPELHQIATYFGRFCNFTISSCANKVFIGKDLIFVILFEDEE